MGSLGQKEVSTSPMRQSREDFINEVVSDYEKFTNLDLEGAVLARALTTGENEDELLEEIRDRYIEFKASTSPYPKDLPWEPGRPVKDYHSKDMEWLQEVRKRHNRNTTDYQKIEGLMSNGRSVVTQFGGGSSYQVDLFGDDKKNRKLLNELKRQGFKESRSGSGIWRK